MNRIFGTLILLFLYTVIDAQDVHFNQYNFASLHVNPANAGLFSGSYRIGGVFRDQAFAISSPDAYKTINFYLDATLPWKIRKNDWVGIGINFVEDRSGEISFGGGGFIGQAAYHLSINPKTTISIGGQYGSSNYNVKRGDKAITESQITTPGSQPLSFNNGAKFKDITIGADLTTALGAAKHNLNIGFAVARINNPSVTNLNSGSAQKLGSLLTGNIGLIYHLNQKLDLRNNIWFRNLKSSKEIIPQCVASYLFNIEKKIRLNAGLGYRTGDALQFMFGADVNNLSFQLAIDQSLSSIKAAQSPSGLGAVEIGARYIGVITKKPNPKPKVFCPRF
ncbi:MAG: PorP/SprF family type IX secretion system membrane protein [Saprospiraceae bacterium]|nr:PorP/SprF family type IX secretion system membrane protein [Saprospiraceae bacterium]